MAGVPECPRKEHLIIHVSYTSSWGYDRRSGGPLGDRGDGAGGGRVGKERLREPWGNYESAGRSGGRDITGMAADTKRVPVVASGVTPNGSSGCAKGRRARSTGQPEDRPAPLRRGC